MIANEDFITQNMKCDDQNVVISLQLLLPTSIYRSSEHFIASLLPAELDNKWIHADDKFTYYADKCQELNQKSEGFIISCKFRQL